MKVHNQGIPEIDLSAFNQPQDNGAEAYWDFRAPGYDREISNSEDSRNTRVNLVQRLIRKGVIQKESAVLDLGCGPGLFTVEFAQQCRQVVGVDISGKMLERARQHAKSLDNVAFYKMDWADPQCNQEWDGAFDLVFANMSPAIRSVPTLEKMMRASKNWCFYSTFAERTSSLRRQLDQLFGICPQYNRIYYLFHILWSRGMQPEIWYESQVVRRELPWEQALEFYQNDYLGRGNEAELKRIVSQHRTADGKVVEEIFMKKGCMLWQVNR